MLHFRAGYSLAAAPSRLYETDPDVEKLHICAGKVEAGGRALTRRVTLEERLVWWVMAHADREGTDVRLSPGQLMKPDGISRQGIVLSSCRCKAQVAFPWRGQTEHINEKELRAAFTEVRRR